MASGFRGVLCLSYTAFVLTAVEDHAMWGEGLGFVGCGDTVAAYWLQRISLDRLLFLMVCSSGLAA